MSEWQPIETAPKDGTRVLYWPRDDEHPVAYWDGDRWRVCCCGQTLYDTKYWMPLPLSPESETDTVEKLLKETESGPVPNFTRRMRELRERALRGASQRVSESVIDRFLRERPMGVLYCTRLDPTD